ncbi:MULTISPECIES: sulfotransferase [Methylomonas]|uniref:sulfotransferase n=1 Tax=Methylomonas TaxID=416 RepID=UPI001681B8A1|nr:sulfotransferase [Methylomonas rhizoryzae]
MKGKIDTAFHIGSACVRSIGKRKIFGIGRNKTGTSSLTVALQSLGFAVGRQIWGERLLKSWAVRDFKPIIRYCHTAQAFQDVPFSLPYTFQAMDMRFKGSKFILTVRDNPEQWYNSLTRFHKKMWGEQVLSSLSELKHVDYCYPGFAYDARALVHDVSEDDPYNKEILIRHYNFHNDVVMDYFRNRPDDLLVLNVAEKGAYKKLGDFLEVPCPADDFPWENKT